MNQSAGMLISVLQSSPIGNAVYSEIQNTTTNANGLAGAKNHTGDLVSGNFASINWASGPYFIKTENDPTG